jgi:hypothetical protein
VDWLLLEWLEARRLSMWVHEPNLVQHMGRVSSLAGKRQPIVSPSFRNTRC